MRFLSILILFLLLTSCGATVNVDYDKNMDFSKYTSYNFYPSIQSGLNQLDDTRIIRITDSLMQERGFIKTDSPQLYVNFYARESISNSRSTLGVGIGSSGRNVGLGVSGGIPLGGRTINQQLTMDLIDAAKDELVWQAVAEGEIKERASPIQKERYYLGIIQKILQKYPPKG